MSKNKYGVEQLKMLSQIEHIREKHFMYTSGPTHVVYELVSNSADECMAGYGNEIILTLKSDQSVEVRDYGRGIPFDIHPVYKVNGLDLALATVNTGGKMDNTKDDGGYEVSSGSYGVGAKIATITSEKMEVNVWREGKHAQRFYSGGYGVGELVVEKNTTNAPNGTLIRWKPETADDLWGDVKFDADKLRDMMKTLAYLLPGIKLIFVNELNNKKYEYCFPDGLLTMVKDMCGGSEDVILSTPIRISGDLNDVANGLDIAFNYVAGGYETSRSFANNVRLSEGGTHVEGFRMGLTRAINEVARALGLLKQKDENFTGPELREGLISVVSVKLKAPRYANQTKTKIDNPEIKGPISSVVYQYLKDYLTDNPKEATMIIENILRTRAIREAMKKAKQSITKPTKAVSLRSKLEGKLAPCKSKDPKETELIICEGRD